jgi:hypothetical protein
MSTQPIIRVTDETTRAEIAEALTNLGHVARREFPVVGTPRAPTPWDRRHQAINALLDDWERAPDTCPGQ